MDNLTLNKQLKNNLIQPYTITPDKTIVDYMTPTVKTFVEYNIKDKVKGKRVLDIGCNTGLFSFFAKQAGASYVKGLDSNLGLIKLAKEANALLEYDIDFGHLKTSKLTENSSQNKKTPAYMLLTKDKFDIAFCMSVYHYLYAQYRNHETIFQILYLIADEIYWENPVNMTDSSCNTLFTSIMPEEISNYTEENILKAASDYFDYEYLGLQPYSSKGYRKAYYFKKKRKFQDYKVLNVVYQNPNTNTLVQKVEYEGKIYALKTHNLEDKFDSNYFDTTYKTLYPKIKHLDAIIQIEKIWNTDTKYHILMEWLPSYIPFNLDNIQKQSLLHNMSESDVKNKLLNKLLFILKSSTEAKIIIVDLSPGNLFFKIENNEVLLKIIDIDPLSIFINQYQELVNNSNENEFLFKYAVSLAYLLSTLSQLTTGV